MSKDLRFSDYIEILTSSYNSIIYNPVYSKELGLYLHSEDDKPIKFICLTDSRLTIHYLDGDERLINSIVMSVVVEDSIFRRRMNKNISGTLFYYDIGEAIFYNLDMTKAVSYDMVKPKRRCKKI